MAFPIVLGQRNRRNACAMQTLAGATARDNHDSAAPSVERNQRRDISTSQAAPLRVEGGVAVGKGADYAGAAPDLAHSSGLLVLMRRQCSSGTELCRGASQYGQRDPG